MSVLSLKTSSVLYIALLLVLSMACGADAAESIEITTRVKEDEFHIGDRIELEVSAPYERGLEIEFAERPEQAGELVFVRAEPLRRRLFGPRITGKVYTMTVYSPGSHVIPPVEVRYRRSPGEEWTTVMSAQAPIRVKSLLTEEDTDIRDIKPVFRYRNLFVYFLIILSVLAVLSAVLFVWLKKQKIKSLEEAARKRPAHEIAYEKLGELKAMRLPEKGMVDEYYMRLSEIVRHYIEGRFFLRAPEMTTEEFLEGLGGSSVLGIEHKELLKDFLSHCDMVKFARYGPTALEMLDSFRSAERFVEQTRPDEEEGSE